MFTNFSGRGRGKGSLEDERLANDFPNSITRPPQEFRRGKKNVFPRGKTL